MLKTIFDTKFYKSIHAPYLHLVIYFYLICIYSNYFFNFNFYNYDN